MIPKLEVYFGIGQSGLEKLMIEYEMFLVFDYCRYVVYWLVIFACKFTFAYFLQARCPAYIYLLFKI